MEPSPKPTSELASRRMRNTPTRDTPAELAVRRLLLARGLRYRVDMRPVGTLRRKADIVFPKVKIAVFIDGCFWHGCPTHGSAPKSNAAWWREKILSNTARDRDTDQRLLAEGWIVLRFWEHDDPAQAAESVRQMVDRRRRL